MFEGPKPRTWAINMVPEGSDLSPVHFQNAVSNLSEDIYGLLIKPRAEVMQGRTAILLVTQSGPGKIRARSLMRRNGEES